MDQTYDFFVSLGADCGTARCLREIKYKDFTYPFDWSITKIACLIELFENNFKDIITKDIIRVGNDAFSNANKTMYFPHDLTFDEMQNENNYNDTVEKYNRRSDRLINILSTNKKIMFVRKCLDDTHDDIIKLRNIIKDKYKNDNFHILFFSSDEKNNILNDQQHITHIHVDKYYFVIYNKKKDLYYHSDKTSYYEHYYQFVKNINITNTFQQVPIRKDRNN